MNNIYIYIYNLYKNKQTIIICLIIIVCYIILLCYEIWKYAIPHNFECNNIIISQEKVYKNYLDNVKKTRSKLLIDGWVVNTTHPVTHFYVKILLKSKNKSYLINTNSVQREDVEKLVKQNRIGVHSSGFVGNIIHLFMKKNTYNIYIIFFDNDKKVIIDTGKKIKI